MASDSFKVKNSLHIKPNNTALTEKGDIRVDETSGALVWHDGSAEQTVLSGAAGVSGPASSTDNAIVRFDGTTGETVQNSGVTIDDSNNMVVAGNLRSDGSVIDLADGTTVSVGTTNSATTVDLGTGSGGNTLNIGNGSGSNTINIGGANSTVNLTGTVNNQNVTNLNVTDKLVTINDGGAAASGGAAGIEVEEDSSITGYMKTSVDRNSWEIKAPNTNGVASLTPGASADVVTLNAASQTLTNKTINGSNNTITNVSLTTGVTGTLPDDNGGTGQSTYTTGDTLYASATNTLSKLAIGSANQVLKISGGVPTWAAAPSGGVNYISANPAAEADTTGWTLYEDAAGTSPVDGTGVATSNEITWTRSTSSPLRDTASFLLTKDAANRQGEGVGFAFTIDAADKAKVLQISFEYAIASGTFADDDVSVWIYDVTNATLIQPAPYKLKNHTLAAERFGCEFQTSSSSTSYRLILHVASTSASAYTLKFDNFSVGPQSKLYGSPVTDWVAFTPTFTGTSNGLAWTNSTTTGYWRRVGDSAEIWIYTVFSAAPATGTGNFQWGLPSGLSIDTTKDPTSGANYGYGSGRDSGTTGNREVYFVSRNGTTAVILTGRTDTGVDTTWNATAPFTMGASDNVTLTFTVPISGWSSSVIMSSDADTRVVAFNATLGTGNHTSTGNTQDVATWGAVAQDTHSAFNTTTGVYTIPVPGTYRITPNIAFAANATGYRYTEVYKNGATSYPIQYRIGDATVTNILTGSIELPFIAGDTFKIRAYQNSGGNLAYSSQGSMSISRISGPAQIAASETVACRYYGSSTTLTNGAAVDLVYSTKDYDTHGAYNNSTGVFTAPIAGKYHIAATMQTAGFAASTATTARQLYVSETSASAAGAFDNRISYTTSAVEHHNNISTTLNMLAGQTFKIQYGHNMGATPTPSSDAPTIVLNVHRIGN